MKLQLNRYFPAAMILLVSMVSSEHTGNDFRTYNSAKVNGSSYEKVVHRLLSALHKRNETARARISILSPMRSTLPLSTARHELLRRGRREYVSTAL